MRASALFLPVALALPAQTPYQQPPKAILDVLEAPAPPALSLAPTLDRGLLVQWERHPGLAELSRPALRLAGYRMNPENRGPHNPSTLRGLTLLELPGGRQRPITLPAGRRFGAPQWAPDGRHFALLGAAAHSTELWLGDGRTGLLRAVPKVMVNAAFGNPIAWMPGSGALLCRTVPAGQAPPPQAPAVPLGPKIQASTGKPAPIRTLQDLLQNAQDERLYEYYATAQLTLVDVAGHGTRAVGAPALFSEVAPSPDGKALLVGLIHKPFSYLVDAGDFPVTLQVWNLQGQARHTLGQLPLADGIPIEGVRTGPRRVQWLPSAPATLAWIEALDGGDPKAKVPHRDCLKTLAAPFTGEPQLLAKVQHRLAAADWSPAGDLVVLREYERERRWSRVWFLNPAEAVPRLVWDRSAQDRYGDPGQLLQRVLPSGARALVVDQGSAFLHGNGATPGGDRPFLDRLDLTTLKTERLFQSGAATLETPVAPLPGGALLTRRESPSEPPNFLLRPKTGEPRALTAFQDPAPILRQIRKQLVTYTRPDGVKLSFTLYLPPDYKEGEKRPALLWAYPMEFTDAGTAGQVSGSPNRFTQFAGISPLFMTLAGYVVIMDATMPVVGDPETVNNTYLEQVVASAQAAVDKAAALGFVDPARVAVGGHSYGAFMTANLLAHSKIFKAGIARSGAYNRTLTPFGFQSERRTLWEAPEMYLKVSPFLSAAHFNAPILLLHGEADNNPGTFPIQSERLFHALKGNGQTVRYVTLPFESHGYVAKESVQHTLWEMVQWLDQNLQGSATAALSAQR